MIVVLLAAGLAGAPGCGKKSGTGQPGVAKAGGATSVEAAARSFVEAAGRRDKAGVIRMLMSDAVCKAQPKRAEACHVYVKELLASVPEMLKAVPKGFAVERVELKPMAASGGQNVKLAMVYPKGGGNPVPLMVMEHNKRFYVGLGIKTADKGPKPKATPHPSPKK